MSARPFGRPLLYQYPQRARPSSARRRTGRRSPSRRRGARGRSDRTRAPTAVPIVPSFSVDRVERSSSGRTGSAARGCRRCFASTPSSRCRTRRRSCRQCRAAVEIREQLLEPVLDAELPGQRARSSARGDPACVVGLDVPEAACRFHRQRRGTRAGSRSGMPSRRTGSSSSRSTGRRVVAEALPLHVDDERAGYRRGRRRFRRSSSRRGSPAETT